MVNAPLLPKTLLAIRNIDASFNESGFNNLVLLVRELQDAVKQLQTTTFSNTKKDSDGLPSHGSPALLDGQWLRLTQEGAAPTVVQVFHGLRRKPVGALWFQSTSINRVLIVGDNSSSISPADEAQVSIELNGNSGEQHICCIF